MRFLSDQVRVDYCQLLQQRVTAAAGFNRRGQGGVVLFDAGFHCRGCMFGAVFNALDLREAGSLRCIGFIYRAPSGILRRQGGVVLFQQRFDIVSTQQRWQAGVVRVDELAQGGGGGESTLRDLRALR